MSLVGTRPPTVDEWEQYELHHRSRMSTKPGIDNQTETGRTWIKEYIERFEDTKKNYETLSRLPL